MAKLHNSWCHSTKRVDRVLIPVIAITAQMLIGIGASAEQAHTRKPEITQPECAAIAARGSDFSPLESTCEYALSRSSLPNIVCDETAERRGADEKKHTEWIVDVIGAEVRFTPQGQEQYSNVTINGHANKALRGPYSGDDLLRYFVLNGHGTYDQLTQYGKALHVVFDGKTKTRFEKRDDINVDGDSFFVFAFHIDRGAARGISLVTSDGADTPKYNGLIWVDKSNGQLRRLVWHAGEMDPRVDVDAWAGATNYGLAEIPQLGTFLVPIGAETKGCSLDMRECWHDIIAIKNCRRFGATTRLMPGSQVEQPKK